MQNVRPQHFALFIFHFLFSICRNTLAKTDKRRKLIRLLITYCLRRSLSLCFVKQDAGGDGGVE